MSVFRDEKKIAELLEQIGGIETPVSEDLEERMISGLEAILQSGVPSGEGSGGGGQFVVTFSDVDLENMTIGLPDKTGAEIYAAIQAGMDVVTYLRQTQDDVETAFKFSLQNYEYAANDFEFLFVCDMPKVQLEISYGYDTKDDEEYAGLSAAALAEKDDIEPMIVHLTLDTSGEHPALVGDKTFGDILDTKNNGKRVMLKLDNTGDDSTLFCIDVITAMYDASDGLYSVSFSMPDPTSASAQNASDYFRHEL